MLGVALTPCPDAVTPARTGMTKGCVTSSVEAGSVGPYMTPMSAPPITELNDRARDVFRVVVDSYLNTGTPIGSRTIAHLSGLNLSPASIRNVMQDLEVLGLLAA